MVLSLQAQDDTKAQPKAKKATPNDKIIADQSEFSGHERWIYNDLPKALKEAKAQNKPLLVVFRCVPCEACSHFDRRVIEPDRKTSELLDKFVCVRVTQANGLDLNQFQFDWDQSFHVIFLDKDKQVLGRFGTRSDRPEDEDMTIAGFQATMNGVLELYHKTPAEELSKVVKGKQAVRPAPYSSPEFMPTLLGTYQSTLAKSGNIARSCIHCHQIRDAERNMVRNGESKFSEKSLYPYPLPDTVGIRLSADHPARIMSVEANSVAEKIGLKAGDDIRAVNGQVMLSPADFQWVLHNAGANDTLVMSVASGGPVQEKRLELPSGWRARSDLSWRPTSWNLRRMATGGLRLDSMSAEEISEGNLKKGQMALKVRHVGQFGEHATAKKAGFLAGDVIVGVDGRTDLLRETDLFAYGLSLPKGTKVKFDVVRKGKPLQLEFPMQ